MAQFVKNLQQCRRMPAIQEIWVGSLGWEDSLEEEMDSSILGWRIPWTEEPGRLTVHGVARVRYDLAMKESPNNCKTFKAANLYYLTASVGQESKCKLTGASGSGFCLQQGCDQGVILRICWQLIGFQAHSCGYWQEPGLHWLETPFSSSPLGS